jgi:hypothetical protein
MTRLVDTSATEQAVERDLDALQHSWPSPIDLRWSPRSMFDTLIYQFLPAFPEVTGDTVVVLARFCRLFAGSILLQDRLLDGDFHAREVGPASMRVFAMQHEAYRALHSLYRPDARLWSRLHDYLVAYAGAFLEEDRFRNGRLLGELTEPLGLAIAKAKHGIAKSIVAALVESSGRDDLLAPLCSSIDAVAVALQMHDDLEDWRLDLWGNTPSILLSRLPAVTWTRADRDDWPGFCKYVARLIYGGGAATYVVQLALDALESTDLTGLPAIPWHQVIAGLIARCRRMRCTIAATVPEVTGPTQHEEA